MMGRTHGLRRGAATLSVVLGALAIRLLAERWAGQVLPVTESWASVRDAGRVDPQVISHILLRTRAPELDRRVLRIVEHDLFEEMRRRPAGRYRLPGTEPIARLSPPPSEPQAAPPPLPQFRVTGVVVLGVGQGMAALQVAGTEERLVSVGETVSGFKLVSVSATEVRLTGPDTVLVLRTQSPNP